MLNSAYQFAAIVLAAGASSRFEDGHKLFQPFSYKTSTGEAEKALILSSLAPVLVAGFSEVIVVTGARSIELRQVIEQEHPNTDVIRFIENKNYQRGMASSIASGMSAVSSSIDGVFIFLADMPLLEGSVIEKLSIAFADEKAADSAPGELHTTICRPQYKGEVGHPVLFGSGHFEALHELRGDSGAREVIAANREHLQMVEVENRSVLIDIDTRDDLISEKLWRERKPGAD